MFSPFALARKTPLWELVMHLVVVGGSDAGVGAALRAQELETDAEITRSWLRTIIPTSAYAACLISSAAKRPTGMLSLIAPSFQV
jgi:hypothetical protein